MQPLLHLALASVLFFHTHLKSSIPASHAELSKSPPAVTLTFTEQVNVGLSSISILRADSTEVAKLKVEKTKDPATITAAVPSVLPAGGYIVRWRTAASDGHVARGTFPFTVKPAL